MTELPIPTTAPDVVIHNPRPVSAHRVHWTRRGWLAYRYSVRCWNCNQAYHASLRWGLSSRVSRCPYCKQPPPRLARSWWRTCFLLPLAAPLCALRSAPSSPRALLEAMEAGYLGVLVYAVVISGVACARIVEADYQAQAVAQAQAEARMMAARNQVVAGRTTEENRKLRQIEARTGKSEADLRAEMARLGITPAQAHAWLESQQ